MSDRRLTLPMDKQTALSLKAGERVLLSGTLYCARDAAHKRLVALLDEGKPLPFDPTDAGIYYAGPTPAKPGQVIGSVGPTTSYRMDDYTPRMLEQGLRVMIGKGKRSQAVIDSMKQHGAVYLGAVGGAGALLARSIQSAEIVAYEDLGAEALRRFTIADFPAVVVIDAQGNNLYEEGPRAYLQSIK